MRFVICSLLARLLLPTSAQPCLNAQCFVNEMNAIGLPLINQFVEVACTTSSALRFASLSLVGTRDGAPAFTVPLSSCLPSVCAAARRAARAAPRRRPPPSRPAPPAPPPPPPR